MDITKLYKIFEILLRDEFAMIYSGQFSNTILTPITDVINAFLYEADSEFKKVHKKVAYMTIENFQNIIRYSETKADINAAKEERDLLLIRIKDKNIFIISSNLVRRKKALQIKKNLDQLNSMDHRELNELFVEKLMNNTFNLKGGAGLGFIEMIRKTKNKLFYKFVPYNDEFVRFYFQIQISKEKSNVDNNLLDSALDIYDIIKIAEIEFLFKSKIGEGRLLPLISMFRDSIAYDNPEFYRRAVNILVEMLQDVFITAKQSEWVKDAVFIFGKNRITGNPYFSVSSYMDRSIMLSKVNTINYYLSLEPDEIDKQYIKFLQDDSLGEEALRFLGIFKSGVNFEYFVNMHDRDKPFFIEKVEVEKN